MAGLETMAKNSVGFFPKLQFKEMQTALQDEVVTAAVGHYLGELTQTWTTKDPQGDRPGLFATYCGWS